MNKTTSRNFSNRWSDPYSLSRGPSNSIVSTPNVNNIGLRSRVNYRNQSAVPILMVKKPTPHHQQEIIVSSSNASSSSTLSSSTSSTKLISSKIKSTNSVDVTSTIKKTKSTIITSKKLTTNINKMTTTTTGGSSTITTITTHPTRLPLIKSLVLSPSKQYMSCNNQQDGIKNHNNKIDTRASERHCEDSSNNKSSPVITNTSLLKERKSQIGLAPTAERPIDENSNAQMLLYNSSNGEKVDYIEKEVKQNGSSKTIEDANINNANAISVDCKILTSASENLLKPVNGIDSSSKQQQQLVYNNDSPLPVSAIKIKQEPISDHYDLDLRPFARGKFAQVKRCVHKKSQQEYAAKCIKKRRRLVDIRHEIAHEIQVLTLANVTNRIVKLYEVYETSNEIILVLEMAEGGELQRVLDDEEAIDEVHVQRIVKQILEGLFYLHKHDIAHLDIKPQNLLLTKKFPDGDIKLCDFGISRHIAKGAEIREICGTPDYVAPEILRYDPISLATDMWSLGVLTYALLSGYSPFGSENKQLTYCNITTANLDFPNECFSNVSTDAIDFIQKLVIKEPTERLSCREALEHRWFK